MHSYSQTQSHSTNGKQTTTNGKELPVFRSTSQQNGNIHNNKARHDQNTQATRDLLSLFFFFQGSVKCMKHMSTRNEKLPYSWSLLTAEETKTDQEERGEEGRFSREHTTVCGWTEIKTLYKNYTYRLSIVFILIRFLP